METRENHVDQKKKKADLPHIFVLLTFIILLISLLTYIIPAGTYDRIVDEKTGRMVIDPQSFVYVEKTPIRVTQFIAAFSKGFSSGASLIFMTLFVGGAFGIIDRLGIIPAIVQVALNKFKKNVYITIPILVLFFGLFDAFLGMPELCIVFIPIVMPLVLRLGFDSITAVAIVICGNCVGFSTGMGNPFSTLIAQKLCGLPLYSGLWFRALTFMAFYIVTAIYITRYAMKVYKNPSSSKYYESDLIKKQNLSTVQLEKLSLRKKATGLFALLCIIINVFGVIFYGWDIPEMTGVFLLMSIVSGILAGHSVNDTCSMFVEGCKDILQGAMVMGFARTIAVVLNESNTIDTVVHALAGISSHFPSQVAILGVLCATVIINFVVNSSSGGAAAVMPILSPLADILGITKQSMVLAFQYGDGWTNSIYPTTASYMGALAVAKVKWNDWLRFQIPLCVIWVVMSAITLLIAHAIQLGPF